MRIVTGISFALRSGSKRTAKAKTQILYGFFLKGASIVIGLILVPLVLNYLDAERYGIWLTLSSIIGWASFFDFGLGNGLRNRLSEAFAINDEVLARKYVSTAYIALGGILGIILILFSIVNWIIPWSSILNTNLIASDELSGIAIIVFGFFILRFFFNLIGSVLLADQRSGISSSFNPLANFLSLAIIFLLTNTSTGSLATLAFVLSSVPVIVLVVATIIFFNRDYKNFKPSIKYFDISYVKDLFSLGLKFFFIQIAAIVFFSTANLLIAQSEGQTMVAAYNISYKCLFTVSMMQGIILTPFWSASTEAFVKQDFNWLKRVLRQLQIISLVLVLILVALLIFSPYVYKIWVGEKIQIPFSLSLVITVYLIVQIFVAPYSQMINGFGKLRLSLTVLTFKLICFIPVCYLLSTHYGALGVVAGMAIIQIPSLIIEPLQVHKLINGTANGIWSK